MRYSVDKMLFHPKNENMGSFEKWIHFHLQYRMKIATTTKTIPTKSHLHSPGWCNGSAQQKPKKLSVFSHLSVFTSFMLEFCRKKPFGLFLLSCRFSHFNYTYIIAMCVFFERSVAVSFLTIWLFLFYIHSVYLFICMRVYISIRVVRFFSKTNLIESVCINSFDDLVLKHPKIPIFSIISCFQDEKLWTIILLDDFHVWVPPKTDYGESKYIAYFYGRPAVYNFSTRKCDFYTFSPKRRTKMEIHD